MNETEEKKGKSWMKSGMRRGEGEGEGEGAD
jgi:hypothetical protein